MKKLLILLISVFVIMSFVSAAEFTPQGNINLRDIYNITNVPSYNGTAINVTGNVTANSFIGNIFSSLYNWVIGAAPSSNYLTFNGTHLDFSETQLNSTINLFLGNGTFTGKISWAEATNGTLYTQTEFDTNYTANDAAYRNTTNSSYLLNTGDTATGDYTFDTDTFFIDSGNNRVGIGTVSPVSPLEIQSLAASMRQTRYATVASQSAGITVQRSGGTTVGTDVIVEDEWRIANFNLRGWDGFVYRTAATIEAWIDGTPGSGDMPGRLTFSTTADGASSATERLRIDSNGSVGIGTTTPQNLLNVLGDINSTGFYYGNGSQLTSLTESQIVNLVHTTDSNETTRFDALVTTDCTAGNLVIGVQDNGTVLCVADAGGIWTNVSGTATYLDDVNITEDLYVGQDAGDQILVGPNSAGNPSYSFAFDTDMGMSSNSANQLRIGVSGAANQITISSTQVEIREDGSRTSPSLTIGFDPNTGLFQPANDALGLAAGGIDFLQLIETTQDIIVFNEEGVDVDFRIETDDEDDIFFIDGNINRIGINTTTPQNLFNVLGEGNFTGVLYANGEIVAGNTSIATYIDSKDTEFNNSMKSYADAQDTTFNTSQTVYTDAQDTTFNTSASVYADAQDVVFNNSMKSYVDVQEHSNETTRFDALALTDCPGGQLVLGVQANGTVTCATDSGAGAPANIFDQVVNTTSNVTTFQLNVTDRVGTDLTPFADSLFDLGTTAIRWLTGFFDFIVVDTLNATVINSKDWTNVSIGSNQVSNFNDSLTSYNDTMKSYVDAQDLTFNTSASAYADAQDVVFNDSMKSYTDATFLVNIVTDTTPQLGGFLDANGQNIGATDDEIENIYVGTNTRIFFGDGQEASIFYNGTSLIIQG